MTHMFSPYFPVGYIVRNAIRRGQFEFSWIASEHAKRKLVAADAMPSLGNTAALYFAHLHFTALYLLLASITPSSSTATCAESTGAGIEDR